MIKNKKGHVVATASVASFVSPPGLIPYCNTKAAVMSLHEGLQQEMRVMYKAPEIKFSVVHPTYAATPMIQPFEDDIKKAGAYVGFQRSCAENALTNTWSRSSTRKSLRMQLSTRSSLVKAGRSFLLVISDPLAVSAAGLIGSHRR